MLTLIYTGTVTVVAQEEVDELIVLAYEWGMDDLLELLQMASLKLPVTFSNTLDEITRQLRSLVGSPLASDISFVLHKKKLFGHKCIIASFSEGLRSKAMEPSRKFMHMAALEDEDFSVEALVDYCILMYGNYRSYPKLKYHTDVVKICATLNESRGLDILITQSMVPSGILPVYEYLIENDMKEESKKLISYMKVHALELCSYDGVKEWPKELVKYLTKGAQSNLFATLQLATSQGDKKLITKAAKELASALNIENATLIAKAAFEAHATDLFTAAIDLVVNNIFTPEKCGRMQTQVPVSDLFALDPDFEGTLCAKFKADRALYALQASTGSVLCLVCSQRNAEKKCDLCKTSVCGLHIFKMHLPDVFREKKSKHVCSNCNSIFSSLFVAHK